MAAKTQVKAVRRVTPAPTGAKARAIAATEPVAPKKRPGKTKKPLAPERVAAILDALYKSYPGAVCALVHTSAWELTVATILSAQCTDARVNLVTPELFRLYPTPTAMAAASLPELEEVIRTTGFFRNKAKSIQGAAQTVVEEFRGEVPQTMEEILRLELTTNDDPQKVEMDLQRVIPEASWIDYSHMIIHHGRQICIARKPRCVDCSLETLCNSSDKTWSSH